MSALTEQLSIEAKVQLTPAGAQLAAYTNAIANPVKKQSFAIQNRVVEMTRPLAVSPGGTATVTVSALGLTAVDFFLLECLTPGKSVQVSLDGNVTLSTLNPPSATDQAFLMGNANLASIDIANPSLTDTIVVVLSFFQKAP